MKNRTSMIFAAATAAASLFVSTAYAGNAIYTTTKGGTAVNFNVYAANTDVYVSGGPQNQQSKGLPNGIYYFKVTDPSGKTLLSTDPVSCRRLSVVGGRVAGSFGGGCAHANGTFNAANGTTPVQLMPFSKTPNSGGVYKVWLSKSSNFKVSESPKDNFKVLPIEVPVGSCQPSSSLSVLVAGTNVAAYVPKGFWSGGSTGISVVTVEGTNALPTTNPIPTTDVVNSCASNSVTGQTVCTANTNSVYKIAGLAAVPVVTTLVSGGTGTIGFSGGDCTNCGVAMDGTNNRALLGLSVGGTGGFQFLNLATNVFEPPFASKAPGLFNTNDISEDPMIDPIRNLLLSASYGGAGGGVSGNYEIVDVVNSLTPAFFENPIVGSAGLPDSSGADCSTGIYLAPMEFSGPSDVFIANLASSSAVLTAGTPGTWTAPSQVQSLSESILSAGASGLAVAQGTHTGIVSGEFGGDAITAIALPTAVDTTATVPAIGDWVTCNIGGSFSNGFDPHTLTAYQSPNAPNHAIAVLANGGATMLAVVDLTNMLDTSIVPRTIGGHACAASPLPASVVSFIPVP